MSTNVPKFQSFFRFFGVRYVLMFGIGLGGMLFGCWDGVWLQSWGGVCF